MQAGGSGENASAVPSVTAWVPAWAAEWVWARGRASVAAWASAWAPAWAAGWVVATGGASARRWAWVSAAATDASAPPRVRALGGALGQGKAQRAPVKVRPMEPLVRKWESSCARPRSNARRKATTRSSGRTSYLRSPHWWSRAALERTSVRRRMMSFAGIVWRTTRASGRA